MIRYFPPTRSIPHITDEDIAYHTRHVDVEQTSCAARIAGHFTALLQSRSLHRNNTLLGRLFCVCVYDGLVACGIDPARIQLNFRASTKHKDDIDLYVHAPSSQHGSVCLYLKTSLRERWKQVDRDARIAKDILGNRIKTVCLTYAERGVEGFVLDQQDPGHIDRRFAEMEQWARGVDQYIALSQPDKWNGIVAYLREDAAA